MSSKSPAIVRRLIALGGAFLRISGTDFFSEATRDTHLKCLPSNGQSLSTVRTAAEFLPVNGLLAFCTHMGKNSKPSAKSVVFCIRSHAVKTPAGNNSREYLVLQTFEMNFRRRLVPFAPLLPSPSLAIARPSQIQHMRPRIFPASTATVQSHNRPLEPMSPCGRSPNLPLPIAWVSG